MQKLSNGFDPDVVNSARDTLGSSPPSKRADEEALDQVGRG